jgi:hypothetical protein
MVFINYNSLYIRYKWRPVIYIYEEYTSNNYKKLQQILLSYNEVVGAGALSYLKVMGPN